MESNQMNTKDIEAAFYGWFNELTDTVNIFDYRQDKVAAKAFTAEAKAGIAHQKQEGWCFDMDKAPDMETLEVYNPLYSGGGVRHAYRSNGGGNPEKYGASGEWMYLCRTPLLTTPKAWRKISPPQPPKGLTPTQQQEKTNAE